MVIESTPARRRSASVERVSSVKENQRPSGSRRQSNEQREETPMRPSRVMVAA